MACPWCEKGFRKPACSAEERKTCDFRTLKWSKEAIISRVVEERDAIKTLIQNPDSASLAVAKDKLSGMVVMRNVLQEHFNMSAEEVQRHIGSLSFAEQMQLAVRLKLLQKTRGGAPTKRITKAVRTNK